MHADRQCALELEALPVHFQRIRRIVSAKLRHWQLDPLIDTAVLGVIELLANVHLHARPDKHCVVELTLSSGHVTISVADSDPRLPRLRSLEPTSTSGRGLALVSALSDGWGVESLPAGGKVVWFTLRADGRDTGDAPPARTRARVPAAA